MTDLLVSPSAATRRGAATAFLIREGAGREVQIVAATTEIASDLARSAARDVGASFGWRRASLGRLAAELASDTLLEQGRTPASMLAEEALSARVVLVLKQRGALGRFEPVGELPGLSRALGRTLRELRLAGLAAADIDDEELSRALEVFEGELSAAGLADRAHVLRAAAARLAVRPMPSLPLCLFDAPIASELEARFVAAIAGGRPTFATAASGDRLSIDHLTRALDAKITSAPSPHKGALGRLQRGLFEADVERGGDDPSVTFGSAPGESRECVEIARRLHTAAETGVRFDRMAVLLRAGALYRPHLVESLRRAGIPAYFAEGARRPDPAGRALLSLLSCAIERLSARRFAEYLSLGVVPRRDLLGRPEASSSFAPADDEQLPKALRATDDEVDPPEVEPLRTPRRWEKLLVESAVLGGLDRWTRRLDGLEAKLRKDLAGDDDADTGRAAAVERDLSALTELRAFAMPLLQQLDALPATATWGEYRERLSRLASVAIARPTRVLSVLAELAPMDSVPGVTLSEVRHVLGPRLTELAERPSDRRDGRVFVGSIDSARGLSFDIVCVPGLAERVFPKKVVEDPILPDRLRRVIAKGLATNADRTDQERLALRLAVGAAEGAVFASYSRVDAESARPRMPSFYALELARAAEGTLPDFGELARRAASATEARLGWPAPDDPTRAIDDAEHDLALLARVMNKPPKETVGTARYLLGANPHLARALRSRGRRFRRGWFPEDGLVKPAPEALQILARHALTARSFSPTALQGYAACPYRFFLYSVNKLAPREDPEPIEEIDALDRGSLVHDVLFRLLRELRAGGGLPITTRNQDDARVRMERILDDEGKRYQERLAPAIPRVWQDGIDQIRADLWVMIQEWSKEETWKPAYFELGFGPLAARDDSEKDEASRKEPVALDCGIQVRGSIDLVETRADGAMRASDYKTGKARYLKIVKIGGGEVLQPVVYSLVLEKMFPGLPIGGGRLYYCTSAGDFQDKSVELDVAAREGMVKLATALDDAIARGFLPAYPKKDACTFCDYQAICGAREERRVANKETVGLEPLLALRSEP